MGRLVIKTQKLLSIVAWTIVMALPIQTMADGKVLFKLKCITCHVLPDPDNLTADMWVPQMERMAVMATLSASQKTEILVYLQANSGTLEDILTEEKVHFDQQCSACHSTREDVPVTAINGTQFEEYLIDHVEDKTDNDLEEEAAHEVAEYLLHSTIR